MRKRATLRVLALTAAALLAAGAGSWSARAATPILQGEGQLADFAPCDFSGGPPPIGTCSRTTPASGETMTCDPAGTSTMDITKDGFITEGPYQGTFTETISATIGPQNGPPAPTIQPFSFSGAQVDSIGLPTGQVLGYTDTFTINGSDGTVITGSKTLGSDPGTFGVCLNLQDETAPSSVFGGGPMTGFFYLLATPVLSYSATISSGSGDVQDSGPAQGYFGDTFGQYDFDSSTAATAEGFYLAELGTTHPASGTTSTAPTPTGTSVAVTPAPGVSITFDTVSGPGSTNVTDIQTVPALPSGFSVGDPATYYDLSTTASFSGSATVCVPYGAPPAGTTPTLLHYDNGQWVDVTTSYDPVAQIVCGSVTSFSPFAAVFRQVPTTQADCANGGWRAYADPGFKNQGDCVSWVATKGKNHPNG